MTSLEPRGPRPNVDRAAMHRRSVREVRELVELDALFDEGVNTVVLKRRLGSELQAEAQAVLSQRSFAQLSTIELERGPSAVTERWSELPRIAEDAGRWAEVLGDLTGSTQIGVRLARLDEAMCPRFHVDRVLVRVVITLVGRGTELLADEDVDRRLLGRPAHSVSDEVSGLVRPGATVRRAHAGDVLFLKGEAWPDNEGRGAVHRSPPASTASPRLVLTLDPL